MLDENCSKYDGPMSDVQQEEVVKGPKAIVDTKTPLGNSPVKIKPAKGAKRREQAFIVRDMITCLGLCHNVTPTYPDPSDKTIKEF